MQVKPERFEIAHGRSINAFSLELSVQSKLDLFDERGGAITEIEAYVHRKIVLFTEEREEPCLYQRGLTQSRSSTKYGQRGIEQ